MSKAKLKKVLAGMLAATMVLGMSMTAFASGTGDTPAKTGGTSGEGSSEGHVEKEVQNVVLPTVPTGAGSLFAYKMDPERLIQETEGEKYADFTFPAKDSDTGVYFLVGDKEYANTSKTIQVINKSSCNVTLTVKVKATASAGGKDITLATGSTPSTSAAELYLGLKVGNDSQVVSATEATVTKTIAGTPTNFETAVENGNYVYREKADATTWKAMNLSMTGAVSSYKIAADTTAPTVDITWEWEKAAESATAATDAVDYTTAPAVVNPTISGATADEDGEGWGYTANFTKGTNLVFTVDFGNQGAEAIDSVVVGGSLEGMSNSPAIATASDDTVTIAGGSWGGAPSGSNRFCKITLDDGTEFIVKLTIQ